MSTPSGLVLLQKVGVLVGLVYPYLSPISCASYTLPLLHRSFAHTQILVQQPAHSTATMADAHVDTIAERSDAGGPRRFEVIEPVAPPADWDAFSKAKDPSSHDYAIKWNFNEPPDLAKGNGLRAYRPKVIAIWMRKGGVAKTSTTFQLGHALASLGCRTMMVDLDSQQDLTEMCFRAVTEAVQKTDVQEYVVPLVHICPQSQPALTFSPPKACTRSSTRSHGPHLSQLL